MTLVSSPQDIDKHNWYYEEEAGIEVIHQVIRDDGEYICTDSIVIPWDSLRRSLSRKDHKKQRKISS